MVEEFKKDTSTGKWEQGNVIRMEEKNKGGGQQIYGTELKRREGEEKKSCFW